MLTNQEIYDRVCGHLFDQGKRAYDNTTYVCKYRTEDGLKCAVGSLIQDAEYSERMEGNGIEILMHSKTYGFSQFSKDNLPLLISLQREHDSPHNWGSELALRTALIRVGIDFGLDCSKVSGLRFGTTE